jgi:hypothetical protein
MGALLAASAAALAAAFPLGTLRAQPAVSVTPSPPPGPPAPPPDDEVPRLTERTALTLDGGTLALGVLAFDYAITNRITVGTAPPFLVLRAASPVVIPNLHLEGVLVRQRDLWISGVVGGYYALVSTNSNASGNVLLIPISGVLSWRIVPRFWVHPTATYIIGQAFGAGNFGSMTLGGTAPLAAAQVGLTLQYELNRWLSVTLWGRYQPYTGAVAFKGSGSIDDLTTATVQAQVTPGVEHPWAVVPGVAMLWQHVRLTLGAGYGNYFIPEMNVSLRGKGFVPDASLMFPL